MDCGGIRKSQTNLRTYQSAGGRFICRERSRFAIGFRCSLAVRLPQQRVLLRLGSGCKRTIEHFCSRPLVPEYAAVGCAGIPRVPLPGTLRPRPLVSVDGAVSMACPPRSRGASRGSSTAGMRESRTHRDPVQRETHFPQRRTTRYQQALRSRTGPLLRALSSPCRPEDVSPARRVGPCTPSLQVPE